MAPEVETGRQFAAWELQGMHARMLRKTLLQMQV